MAIEKTKLLIPEGDYFRTFVDSLKDLQKLSDKVICKISDDTIYMYGWDGEARPLVFKSIILNRKQIFHSDSEWPGELNMIIPFTKQITDKLHLINGDFGVRTLMEWTESAGIHLIRRLTFSDGRLMTYVVPGNYAKVNAQFKISQEQLKNTFSEEKIKWSFNLKLEDLLDMKRLCRTSEDGILNIFAKAGKVKAQEKGDYGWTLDIDEIEDKSIDQRIAFHKKYLSHIKAKDELIVNVFESAIQIVNKEDDNNIIITYEKTY